MTTSEKLAESRGRVVVKGTPIDLSIRIRAFDFGGKMSGCCELAMVVVSIEQMPADAAETILFFIPESSCERDIHLDDGLSRECEAFAGPPVLHRSRRDIDGLKGTPSRDYERPRGPSVRLRSKFERPHVGVVLGVNIEQGDAVGELCLHNVSGIASDWLAAYASIFRDHRIIPILGRCVARGNDAHHVLAFHV